MTELLSGSGKDSILGVIVSVFYKEALPAYESAVSLLFREVEGILHVVN